MGWGLNAMSDPIINPPPKAAKRLATVFQKHWWLAAEVGCGLNAMSDPILNPPPKAAKRLATVFQKTMSIKILGRGGLTF